MDALAAEAFWARCVAGPVMVMHHGNMPERLIVVTDAFDLGQRGTALVPALDYEGTGRHCDLDVELRHPDGTSIVTRARLMVEHFHPGGYKRVVYVDLPKTEAPAGTEVWVMGD